METGRESAANRRSLDRGKIELTEKGEIFGRFSREPIDSEAGREPENGGASALSWNNRFGIRFGPVSARIWALGQG